MNGLVSAVTLFKRRRRLTSETFRPILMMLLVELRSGLSVLSALQAVSRRFPENTELLRSVNLATVSGMHSAVAASQGRIRMLITQLARVQISGASAADAVRRMLEADAARDRAQQLAKTKALPVRLMVPLTLMILPGVVLLVYGPTLIDVLGQVMDPFG
jgi:pilus assembly protein TadC